MWLWAQPHDVFYIDVHVLALAINCCSYGVSTGEDLVGTCSRGTAKDHMTSLVTYMYRDAAIRRTPIAEILHVAAKKTPISDRRY